MTCISHLCNIHMICVFFFYSTKFLKPHFPPSLLTHDRQLTNMFMYVVFSVLFLSILYSPHLSCIDIHTFCFFFFYTFSFFHFILPLFSLFVFFVVSILFSLHFFCGDN
uniref:SJCHGC02634 protein n=1 Tax=Schistosoma japonicum TaxID=6182 RepID=Q5DHN1_SCHJA|nr:SJCHGC02634 protein [Schistosoma japonicum]